MAASNDTAQDLVLTRHPFLFVLALTVVLYVLYLFISDPLRTVPGPFAARITRLWAAIKIGQRHFEQVTIDLHRRYGSVVRIAPNYYSISSPQALKPLYGTGSKYIKHGFYRALGHPDESQADLFSTVNPQLHATLRRKVSPLYNMSSVVTHEGVVDDCNSRLIHKFKELSGQIIDLPTWIQYHAFDTIAEITCGKSFDLVEAGKDDDNILAAIHQTLDFGTSTTMYHELNPYIIYLVSKLGFENPIENIGKYVSRQLEEHRQDTSRRRDFMGQLFQMQTAEKLDDGEIYRTVFANIAAGADTTAITISAALYYLTRNPLSLNRLREEITNARAQNTSSSATFSFAETRQMPYLQAVVKETLRLHPSVGMFLPRVVPSEGLSLLGYDFPAGAVVGVNAWALHRDKLAFGSDASDFNPDRWLGAEDDVATMERTLLSFGQGARTCIGKNLTLLEITKILPLLVEEFDFQLQDSEWTTENIFFVKQTFDARVVTRTRE